MAAATPRARRPDVRLSVTNSSGRPVDRARLRRLARAVEAQSGDRSVNVALVLAGDPELQDLNRRFRGQDHPTDVLSFEAGPPPPGSPPGDAFLGDLAISLDAVERQAQEHRHPPARELEILFVHGLLHLLGHDHQGDREHRAMEAAAAAVLEATP
ncbi:MAG: rRNA maturation RNase YbeY [Candidatus Dormibacteria bacterium]